jgi:tetratricopeptide (TPR) repeat protein
MKTIIQGAFVAFCIVYLGGCALPEKPKLDQPPSTTSSSPVYIQETIDGQSLERPKYMDIGEQQEEPIQESGGVVLPSDLYINDRISEYERKLDRWEELDRQSVTMKLKDEDAVQMVRCYRRLQDVLSGYTELRDKMLQADTMDVATKISNEEIFELQKSDIAFLENSCGRLLDESEDKGTGWNQPAVGTGLSQLEALIDRYAADKEYDKIIDAWLKIAESERGRVNLRSKIFYGNALLHLQQEQKAAEIYQQVVDQMSASDEQATDLVSLRKVLADIYTASGNYTAASTEYQKISEDYRKIGQLEEWSQLQLSLLERSQGGSPELNEFSEILRNFLGYTPERDGYTVVWQAEKFKNSYPYSLVIANVDLMKDSVSNDADKWFNGFMNEVDGLSAEKKFAEAIRLLETIPTDILGADKQMQLQAKNEQLVQAEAVENETGKMALTQDLQNQWNNGMLLVNGQRYEEAIDVFTSLLDTEYSAKARAKISELTLDAANADRRKAADLFIRYTKTTDLESRKKLLVESRKYLKNILVKYPEVEIASKVRGNIERVEQEMNAIDPNLVFMADQDVAPQVQDDGIDSAFTSPPEKTTLGTQAPVTQ